MSTLLNWIVTFFTSKWSPIGITLAALIIVYQNVMSVMIQVRWVIAKMDEWVAGTGDAPNSVTMSAFSLINYIIPLDLAIALFVLWMPIFLMAASIRLTKSFIPTIAS